jgi:hypothetical protein
MTVKISDLENPPGQFERLRKIAFAENLMNLPRVVEIP